MTPDVFPLDKLGTLIFMMMGPVALIPLFSGATATADAALRRSIAVRAFFYASIALALAVAIGAGVLESWGASRPALVIAAGVLLTLASLRHVLGQAHAEGSATAATRKVPSLSFALSPLAFPSIVTPYGVGVLIVFVAYAPDASVKLSILGIALAVMLVDLLAMLFAHRLIKWIGIAPLAILGAVFGVLQIALGIEMIASGIAMRLSGGT